MRVTAVSSVPQAFQQTAEMLVQLREQWKPEQVDQFQATTAQTLAELKTQVAAIPSQEWQKTAGQLALTALAQGLLCGALDGAILYQTGSLSPLASASGESEFDQQFTKLLNTLGPARKMADENWRNMSADDLQLMSGYGKHENRLTLEEAEQAAKGTALEFQTFLLATFKAGYAVGLIDAAVVFIAGERPGQEKV